jgi:hypothetical protein
MEFTKVAWAKPSASRHPSLHPLGQLPNNEVYFMGRQLRRVQLDFSWPQHKVWDGFVNHHYGNRIECEHCDETGSSPEARELSDVWYGKGSRPFRPEDRGSKPYTEDTPEIRAFAERNVTRSPEYYGPATDSNIRREARRLCEHFNQQWSHHLNQDDVDALVREGRLIDFTHTFTKGIGWQPKDPQVMPTAEEVNRWSISGAMGHDSINQWVVVKAELERQGKSSTCEHCQGHGFTWPSLEAEAEYENWKETEPPEGPGYQLWETVSEGSPISPVFETAEELAQWLAGNRQGSIDDGTTYEQWMRFICGSGWAPSLVGTSQGLVSGVQAVEFLGSGEQRLLST